MEIIEKGQCGERVSYELYEDGTLKIFGVGEMYNYTDYSMGGKISPFRDFSNKLKKVIILLGVTTIGDYAFYCCQRIISVDLPDSIFYIGYNAFEHCYALKNIVIPDSVTTIKAEAFNSCYSLWAVKLGNNIVFLANSVFKNCGSLEAIKIPDSVTIVENSAFESCRSLYFVDIPNSVTKIGSLVFNYCHADTVKIGRNVVIMEWNVFGRHNKLANIIVDEQNKKYSSENGVLYNKDKSVLIKYPSYKEDIEFVVPESVKRIENLAFVDCCFLRKIKITKNVVELGDKSFYDCKSLRIVEFDGMIETINNETFYGCENIFSMLFVSEMPPIVDGEDAFISIVETAEICVPKNSINHYKSARGWNRFTNYVAIEDEN